MGGDDLDEGEEAEGDNHEDEADLGDLGHNDEQPPPPPPPPPAKKKAPPPPLSTPPKQKMSGIDDLAGRMMQCKLGKDQIEVVTVVKENQTIRGDVVKTRDVLASEITLPPGSAVRTLSVAPNPANTNNVSLDVDIDPALSDGKNRVPKRWRRKNKPFAEEMESLFQIVCHCLQGWSCSKGNSSTSTHHGRVQLAQQPQV